MGHDQREGSPTVTDLPMTPALRRRNDFLNDIPPRSPLSKAFDFFPWSKCKKTNDKKDEPSKNVFRNSGSIRDILSEKLMKNKTVQKDKLYRYNTTTHAHKYGRRLSRNKSLDIEEILKKCDAELKAGEDESNEKTETPTFLDDTFIENYIKNETEQQVRDFNENIMAKNLNNQRHILFNDENIIYLIRKEKPVTKSCNSKSKDKSRTGVKQKNGENNNNNGSNVDSSVIKARLKFKKVPKASQDDSNVTTETLKTVGSNKRTGGILNRQQSLDSQLCNSSFGRSRTPETILENVACNSNESCETDRQKINLVNKPRKKLSFRDPVVFQKKSALAENQINSRTVIDTSRNEKGQTNARASYDVDSDLESQAMRIVRTVGQAFEVCHKYNHQKNSLENNDERSDLSSDILDQDRISEQLSEDELLKKDHHSDLPDSNNSLQRPNHLEIVPQINNSNYRKSTGGNENEKPPGSPMSSTKEIQKLKEQLEQQALQTRQALSQLMLVREQLISETNARIEAQARTQQLLQQNRELLEHLASLGGYTEPSQSGLTSANIGLAPQSQLQMLLQDQTDLSSPMRKTFLSSPNNNNLTSITQQLNNLGSINQQLTTLSHQLSGLNQQSQNLQNFQNLGNSIQTIHTANAFPNLNQIQNISNKLSNLSQPPADALTQNDLYQMNQELLNRLQALNLGFNTPPTSNGSGQNHSVHHNSNNNSPQNSFFFANPGHLSNSPNNNNNFNFLNSPGSLGNLTPSPIATINRKSYSNSPMDESLAISIEKNLNSIDETHFIKPLSQVGTLTTLDTDGKVKVIVPVSNGEGGSESNISRRDGGSSPNRRSDQNFHNLIVPSTVTLKVTDESGNSRKLSATPSFITRSTSEKVPNRSQMMSQVQRTAWARHTTK